MRPVMSYLKSIRPGDLVTHGGMYGIVLHYIVDSEHYNVLMYWPALNFKIQPWFVTENMKVSKDE